LTPIIFELPARRSTVVQGVEGWWFNEPDELRWVPRQ
jgi:hypothetical protein